MEWLRPRRRVGINEVNAGVGQFLELLQVVAAVNDARVEKRGGFLARGRDAFHSVPDFRFARRSLGRGGTRPYRIGIRAGSFLGYYATLPEAF